MADFVLLKSQTLISSKICLVEKVHIHQILIFAHTVSSEIEAAASNYFGNFFGQNLLSKNCVLLRLLFEGGFYLRAASISEFTVNVLQEKTLANCSIVLFF